MAVNISVCIVELKSYLCLSINIALIELYLKILIKYITFNVGHHRIVFMEFMDAAILFAT